MKRTEICPDDKHVWIAHWTSDDDWAECDVCHEIEEQSNVDCENVSPMIIPANMTPEACCLAFPPALQVIASVLRHGREGAGIDKDTGLAGWCDAMARAMGEAAAPKQPLSPPSPQLIGHCIMCHLPKGHPDCKAHG